MHSILQYPNAKLRCTLFGSVIFIDGSWHVRLALKVWGLD